MDLLDQQQQQQHQQHQHQHHSPLQLQVDTSSHPNPNNNNNNNSNDYHDDDSPQARPRYSSSRTKSSYPSPSPIVKSSSQFNLSSCMKMINKFNGKHENFNKWNHEVTMAFKLLGFNNQLIFNYFESITNRTSNIYIPSGETPRSKLKRESNYFEDEHKHVAQPEIRLDPEDQTNINLGYALIWSSLGDELQHLFLPPNTEDGNPYDLYTCICKKYKSLSQLDQYRLQQQLDELKLNPNEDMDLFFSRVLQLGNQLSKAGIPINEEQIKYRISKALPNEYKMIFKTFQISKPNMSLDELRAYLREEQAEMKSAKSTNTGSANAFMHNYSEHKSKNKNKSNNNKSKNKHVVQQENKKSVAQSTFDATKATCYRCGEIGHISTDCKHDKTNLSCTYPGCTKPSGSHNYKAHAATLKAGSKSGMKSKFGGGVFMEININNKFGVAQHTSEMLVAQPISSTPTTIAAPVIRTDISATLSAYASLTSSSSNTVVNNELAGLIALIVDSGCTAHAVNSESYLLNIRAATPIHFGIADARTYISTICGDLEVLLDDGVIFTLSEVRYVPGIAVNLISVHQMRLSKERVKTVFDPDLDYAILTNKSGETLHVPNVGMLSILHGKPIIANGYASPSIATGYALVHLPSIPEDDKLVAQPTSEKLVAQPVKSVALPISQMLVAQSTSEGSLSNIKLNSVAQPTAEKLVVQPTIEQNKLLCYNINHGIDGTAPANAAAYSNQDAGSSIQGGALLSEYDLWHNRLGHLAKSGLETVIKSNCVHGMNIKDTTATVSLSNCPSCQIAKIKRSSFSNIKTDHIISIMDQWDMDLCGPIHSSAGTHYMLLIIDVYSRYIFIEILKSKDEAEQYIINKIKLEQNQTGKKLRKLHSDGGGEFNSTLLNTFCAEQGILKTDTTRNTPQHNAKVERANGTIINGTRTTLLHADVPDGFWPYAAINEVYIRNRVTTKGINIGTPIKNQITPFQVWFSHAPDIKHLRVLFCDCYYVNEVKEPGKLTPPGVSAIYVGYNEIKSGYNCYDIATDKVVTTRNVTFVENSFTHSAKLKSNYDSSAYDYTNQSEQDLFNNHLDQNELELVKQISLQEYKSNSSSSTATRSIIENVDKIGPIVNKNSNSNRSTNSVAQPTSKKSVVQPTSNNNKNGVTQHKKLVVQPISSSTPSVKQVVQPSIKNQVAQPVSQNHVAQPKTKVKFDSINEDNIITSGTSRNRNKVLRLGMVDYERDVSAHSLINDDLQHAALSVISGLPDPKNYKEAMSSPDVKHWLIAMQKEYKSLTENETWKLVEQPKGSHIMGCRWVYKKKIDAEGNITYKARLCAQGFSQTEDEYGETYAPVLGYTSLRILLSIATRLDYDLNQWDVCTAFLNAYVKEVIYMKQPEGFVSGDGKVCRLLKTLYGLKQSPNEWNKLLHSFFIEHGWVRCVSDPCVYWKMSKTNHVMFTGVFVDDSIAGNSPADRVEFNEFKALFMKRFKSVDLGEVKQILGMIVVRDRKNGTLFLHQKPYLLKVLKTFNMLSCKTAPTPESLSLVKLLPTERIPVETDIDVEQHKIKMSQFPYNQYLAIVGSLIYAMISTRPDLAHAVHILSKYMSNYTELHYKCAKHVLRYLAGTVDYGLLFKSSKLVAQHKNEKSVAQPTSIVTTGISHIYYVPRSITSKGMSDANYGGERESLTGNIKMDYKSTQGSLVYITSDGCIEPEDGDLVDWKADKQKITAQSSCESEFMATCKTANKMVWSNSLLSELGFKQTSPSTLYVDNQAAIALSKNTYTGDKSRHIAIPFHVVKDYTANLQIDTKWIDTKSQTADILTKALSKDLFIPLRDKLVYKLK